MVFDELSEARATKHFFGMAELPINVKVVEKGKGVEVCAVGLAQVGLLASLELGFQNRRLWIIDGTVTSKLGLFRAIFDLAPFDQNESSHSPEKVYYEQCERVVAEILPRIDSNVDPLHPAKYNLSSPGMLTTATPFHIMTPANSPKKLYCEDTAPQVMPKSTMASEKSVATAPSLTLNGEKDARTNTASELAEVDAAAARDGAIARLTIVRKWSQGIRAAIMEMLDTKGLEITLARVSSVRRKGSRHIKDTFWLAPRTEGQHSTDDQSLPGTKPQWLIDLGILLEKHSPRKVYTPAQPFLETSSIKIDIMKELQTEQSDMLPHILRKCYRKLPYDLHACHDLGVQVDGFAKFSGEGMAISHFDGSSVLEFSTYFVAVKDAVPGAKTGQSWLSAVVRDTKGYSEFVTQYEPKSQRLTVFKVFLNKTLPSGQRLGCQVAAEQLLNAKILGHSNTVWDGASAIRNLREIHLCDVVNWNTYVILSQVGKEQNTDMDEWVLKEELAAAGLQLQDLKTKTMEVIFSKTALGKLVHAMLREWSQANVASHSVQNVTVLLNNAKHERICNEFRPVMDVMVHFRNGLASNNSLDFSSFGA